MLQQQNIPQDFREFERMAFDFIPYIHQLKTEEEKNKVFEQLESVLLFAHELFSEELGRQAPRLPKFTQPPQVVFALISQYRRMQKEENQISVKKLLSVVRKKILPQGFQNRDSQLMKSDAASVQKNISMGANQTNEPMPTRAMSPANRHPARELPACQYRSEVIKKGGCSCNDIFHCTNPQIAKEAGSVDKKRSECRRCILAQQTQMQTQEQPQAQTQVQVQAQLQPQAETQSQPQAQSSETTKW